MTEAGNTPPGDALAKRGGQRRSPTLRTISEATGLAITTVSRALKDGPELSAETRARVREVATQLGYRPHRAGVRLRTGRTFVIGLILDQNVTIAEFERRIILGVSQVLASTNYHLVVAPLMLGADPMEPIRYFVETAAADGLMFTHTQPDDPRVRYLLDCDFPFVAHGRTEIGQPHPYYDFDNERMAAEAVARLAARGRRRIAIVLPAVNQTCARHMSDGFRAAVAKAGIEGVVVDGLHLDSDPLAFRGAARALAEGARPPDGVICANETRCVALMAGLQDAGLRVGVDIDVIAKDTSDLLDHATPTIDSYFEDLTFAGEELARLLLKRLAGASVEELQTLAPPQLRCRT